MNTIQERIEKLKTQQHELSQNHDKMVAEFQEATRQFQQRVQANQARYQQLTGAINELNRILITDDNQAIPGPNREIKPLIRSRK